MIPELENTEKSLQVCQQTLKMEANISIQVTRANKLEMFIILKNIVCVVFVIIHANL